MPLYIHQHKGVLGNFECVDDGGDGCDDCEVDQYKVTDCFFWNSHKVMMPIY